MFLSNLSLVYFVGERKKYALRIKVLPIGSLLPEVMKMTKDEGKKKFDLPTEANTDGEIEVQNGLRANYPFDYLNKMVGDSVKEHKSLEAANEIIAEKEIGQSYNNS
jgi:hypothetical protein